MALNMNNAEIDMHAQMYAQMQQRINELEQKMAGVKAKPSAKPTKFKTKPTEGGVKRGRMAVYDPIGKGFAFYEKSDDPDCCNPCGMSCKNMCNSCERQMESAISPWQVKCRPGKDDDSDSDSDGDCDSDDEECVVGAARKRKAAKKAAKKSKKAKKSGTKEERGICAFPGCTTKSRRNKGRCAEHRPKYESNSACTDVRLGCR
jgi:hypothetical protein